jgi:hypothetical protein
MGIRALVVIVLLYAVGAAQTGTSKVKKDQAKPQPRSSIPAYEIALSEDTDYQPLPSPKELQGNFFENGCVGDGNLYVVISDGLVAITPKGIISFLRNKMTDIPHPSMDSFGAVNPAISGSGIFFSLNGVDDAKVETATWTDDEGREHVSPETRNATLNYIARFDRDGTYKGATRVDGLPFVIYTFAAFDSGNLIAAGLDWNGVQHTALLDAKGQFLRYLDLGKGVTAEPPSAERNPMAAAFGRTFVPWQGKMLVLRTLGGKARMYEIQEGGEVRIVNIKLPAGYQLEELEELVPTDKNWLVRFNKPDSKAGRSSAFDSLLEMDPQNGEPVRQYRVKPPDKLPETVVSCFFDGEFWGLRQDVREGKLRVVRGAAAPYRGEILDQPSYGRSRGQAR